MRFRTAVAVVFVAAAGAAAGWTLGRPSDSRGAGEAVLESEEWTGREMVSIVFAMSSCPACNDERLAAALTETNDRLRQLAADAGERFRTIALMLDKDANTGFKFAQKLGAFDEIVAGGGWLSLGASRLIWEQALASPAVPQILVLQRYVDKGGERIVVSDEGTVVNVVGVEEIARAAEDPEWLQQQLSHGRRLLDVRN